MKHTSLTRMGLATLLLVASTAPANAQNLSQLKQENARLKAELRALQAQGCTTHQSGDASHANGAISANMDSIRVGPATGFASGHVAVTVTLTLRNTANAPLILNYQKGSFSATDDRGYQYELKHQHLSSHYSKDIKGIPMATPSRADTTSIISAGSARTVTFTGIRYMRDGQSPGNRFDIAATFIQLEDLGQGRVRKVRDFPVAFTNAPASGL